jgi:hypothetical protein
MSTNTGALKERESRKESERAKAALLSNEDIARHSLALLFAFVGF